MPEIPPPQILPPVDWSKTANALAQQQEASAHSQLYNLQAMQQQMRNNAVMEYQRTNDPKAFIRWGQPDLADQALRYGTIGQEAKQKFLGMLGSTVQSMPKDQREDYVNQELARAHREGLITEKSEAIEHYNRFKNNPGSAIAGWQAAHPAATEAVSTMAPKVTLKQAETNIETEGSVNRDAGRAGVQLGTEAATQGQKMTPEKLRALGRQGAGLEKPPSALLPADKMPVARGSDMDMGIGPPATFNSRFGAVNPSLKPAAATPASTMTAPSVPPAAPPVVKPKDDGSIQLMTPGQKAEATALGAETGKTLGALPDQYAKEANASKLAKSTISNMRLAAQDIPMGWGTEWWTPLSNVVKPFAQALGVHSFDRPVASAHEFEKYAQDLVSTATKAVSSRAAAQEMVMISKSIPARSTPREAFNDLTDSMEAAHDFRISKQSVANTYQKQNGSLKGFEPEWADNITPSAFKLHNIVQRNPEEAKQVIERMRATPEGQKTVDSIIKQIRWGEKYGAFDHITKG